MALYKSLAENLGSPPAWKLEERILCSQGAAGLVQVPRAALAVPGSLEGSKPGWTGLEDPGPVELGAFRSLPKQTFLRPKYF